MIRFSIAVRSSLFGLVSDDYSATFGQYATVNLTSEFTKSLTSEFTKSLTSEFTKSLTSEFTLCRVVSLVCIGARVRV